MDETISPFVVSTSSLVVPALRVHENRRRAALVGEARGEVPSLPSEGCFDPDAVVIGAVVEHVLIESQASLNPPRGSEHLVDLAESVVVGHPVVSVRAVAAEEADGIAAEVRPSYEEHPRPRRDPVVVGQQCAVELIRHGRPAIRLIAGRKHRFIGQGGRGGGILDGDEPPAVPRPEESLERDRHARPERVFGIPERAIDEAIGRTRSAGGVDEERCRAIEPEEEGFGDLRGGGERRPVRPDRIEPSRGAELRGGDRGNGEDGEESEASEHAGRQGGREKGRSYAT